MIQIYDLRQSAKNVLYFHVFEQKYAQESSYESLNYSNIYLTRVFQKVWFYFQTFLYNPLPEHNGGKIFCSYEQLDTDGVLLFDPQETLLVQ